MRRGRDTMTSYQRTSARTALAESYEWQLTQERNRAEDYKKAWEAEKQINQAHIEWTNELQTKTRQQRQESFLRGLLTGIATALVLAMIVSESWGNLR